jgi:hypothetical protein
MPQRWTELGIAVRVIGWVDTERIILETDRDVRLVQRDGTGYKVADGMLFGPDFVQDRTGQIRFLRTSTQLFRFGRTELEPLALTRAQVESSREYGWTSDNRYYLRHSTATQEGDTSGVFILEPEGTIRQVAAELTGRLEFFTTFLDSREPPSFAPSSSRMALIWYGKSNPGIYLIDAGAANVTQMSTVAPDRLFWADETFLIYVIRDGDAMGTWFLPLNGEPAQKLFAFRATQVGKAPQGGVFIVANNTLWHYDPQRDPKPQMLGAEGRYQSDDAFVPLTLEPLTRSEAALSSPIEARSPAVTLPAAQSAERIEPQAAFAWFEAPPSQDSYCLVVLNRLKPNLQIVLSGKSFHSTQLSLRM